MLIGVCALPGGYVVNGVTACTPVVPASGSTFASVLLAFCVAELVLCAADCVRHPLTAALLAVCVGHVSLVATYFGL